MSDADIYYAAAMALIDSGLKLMMRENPESYKVADKNFREAESGLQVLKIHYFYRDDDISRRLIEIRSILLDFCSILERYLKNEIQIPTLVEEYALKMQHTGFMHKLDNLKKLIEPALKDTFVFRFP